MVAVTRTLSVAFLAASTVLGRRLAMEELARVRAGVTWESKDQVWCISEEGTLGCDEDSVIKVRTAMYNRNLEDRKSGQKCEPAALGRQDGCSVKGTDSVRALCDGHQACTIPAEAHSACRENPFTFMRVRYECISGEPKNPDEVVDGGLQNPVQTATEPVAKDEVLTTTSTRPGETAGVDLSRPVEIKKVKGARVVKKQVEEDLSNRQVVTTALVPCWRATRWDRVMGLQFFDKLTNCSDYEGCFRLAPRHGLEFDDKDRPPTSQEILQSGISEGEDSLWVTWNGLNLQRNKHRTWGVCLPKTGGLEYALQTFSSIKELVK